MNPVFDQTGEIKAAGSPFRRAMPGAMEICIGSMSSTRQLHSARSMIPCETIAMFASWLRSSKKSGRIHPVRNDVARLFIEAFDSLSMCADDAPGTWRVCISLPLEEAAGAVQRSPSKDPKSRSRKSGVKIGVRGGAPSRRGWWRHMPSAVRRALLRSDAKTEPK